MLKIVISYPAVVTNEIALVNNLLSSDIDYFHIRKPQLEEIELEEYIKQLDEKNYSKILLHSYFKLAVKYNLGGIHINKKQLAKLRTEEESDQYNIEPLMLKNSQVFVNNVLPNIVSYSAHSFKEIETIQFKTDYVMLSPIFDSISKRDYESKFTNHAELKRNLKKTAKRIIALGGIRQQHISQLKKLGFFGYAILGEFWEQHLTNNPST